MKRTAIITITADDDTQNLADLQIDYSFEPPLGPETEYSALANVVGYLLQSLNKVAVSGQLDLSGKL